MNIARAEFLITSYSSEFFNRLDTVGFSDFKTGSQNQTKNLLMKRVYPKRLKEEMYRYLILNESLKSLVRKFVKKLHWNLQTVRTILPNLTKRINQITNFDTKEKDKHDQKRCPLLCLWKPAADKIIRHKLAES